MTAHRTLRVSPDAKVLTVYRGKRRDFSFDDIDYLKSNLAKNKYTIKFRMGFSITVKADQSRITKESVAVNAWLDNGAFDDATSVSLMPRKR